MGQIRYSVPMRRQEQNPICWIACVAMIRSFKGKISLGIGEFTGGFDPSNSSIPDPVNGWDDFYRRLERFGFQSENPNMSPNAVYIEAMLRQHGPWMLTHLAGDVLPGTFQPGATHAVVITGVDTNTNQVWFNNPWGTVDEVRTCSTILLAIGNMITGSIRPIAYMP
jgi:hypothetical protein